MKGPPEYSPSYIVLGLGRLTRPEALRLIWRFTHDDFKGTSLGVRTILTMRAGGTTLVPLDCLTDAEVQEKLPYAVKKEIARKVARARGAGGNFGGPPA